MGNCLEKVRLLTQPGVISGPLYWYALMRFAVDAHAIGRHLTGNEVYVRSLLNAFGAQDQDDEFIAYVSAESAAQSSPERIQHPAGCHQSLCAPGVRPCDEGAAGPPRPAARAVHGAAGAARSPWWSACTTSAFWSIPNTSPATAPGSCSGPCGAPCTRAAKILTGSEFSRSSILKVYGDLDEDKVVVVPNAAASRVPPDLRARRPPPTVRERFEIAAPFILSVGDLQPRKNQIGLIRAFARLVQRLSAAQAEPGAGRQGDLVRRPRARGGARFRRGRPHPVLRLRLRRGPAAALQRLRPFVFPSFYEGFGLPALEAMACGRAVVCSNTSALPEVVDGAAILFDPYAIDEIVRAHGRPAAGCRAARAHGAAGPAARGALQLAEDRAADARQFSTMCVEKSRRHPRGLRPQTIAR